MVKNEDEAFGRVLRPSPRRILQMNCCLLPVAYCVACCQLNEELVDCDGYANRPSRGNCSGQFPLRLMLVRLRYWRSDIMPCV